MVTQVSRIFMPLVDHYSIRILYHFGTGTGGRNECGAGSGYINYLELDNGNAPYVQYGAKVGTTGESSEVTDLLSGTTVLVGPRGGNSGYWDNGGEQEEKGGNGYSGGGSSGGATTSGCPGGMAGSNGYSCLELGGFGSGFDVQEIPIKSFTIRSGIAPQFLIVSTAFSGLRINYYDLQSGQLWCGWRNL